MSNSNIHGIDHNAPNHYSNNQYDPNDNAPIFSKFLYRGDPKQQSIPNFIKKHYALFFFQIFFFYNSSNKHNYLYNNFNTTWTQQN